MAAHTAFLSSAAAGHVEVASPAARALRALPPAVAAAAAPGVAVDAPIETVTSRAGMSTALATSSAVAAIAMAGLATRRGARRNGAVGGGRRAIRLAAIAQGGAVASSKEVEADAEIGVAEPSERAGPSVNSLLRPSALPWLPEPAYRRYVRNVPGDFGFDPLNLAGANRYEFVRSMESELKHSRLAMLAGIGFAAPELLHHRLADLMGLPSLMAPGGCTPTLLNGQLLEEPVLAAGLGSIFALIAFTDIMKPEQTGLPGYYGFDPLGLGDVEFSKMAKSMLSSNVEWVAEAEVKHGRVAMVAVTYMAFREFLTGTPTWPSL